MNVYNFPGNLLIEWKFAYTNYCTYYYIQERQSVSTCNYYDDTNKLPIIRSGVFCGFHEHYIHYTLTFEYGIPYCYLFVKIVASCNITVIRIVQISLYYNINAVFSSACTTTSTGSQTDNVP